MSHRSFSGLAATLSAMVISAVLAVSASGFSFQDSGKYWTNAYRTTSVEKGDFNKDGNLDLVTTNWDTNDISVMFGKGDGTIFSVGNFNTGQRPTNSANADFNSDGNLDLLVSNSGGNSVSLLLGNGNRTFQAATNFSIPEGFPSYLTIADFNRDGKKDFVVTQGHSLLVFLGNGDGTFRTPARITAGDIPEQSQAADFNGDGNLDLAVANQVSSDVSVLLGNGDGTFGPAASFGARSYPRALLAGDFNLDGKMDLAVSNELSNTITILRGKGDGTFEYGSDLGVPRSSSSLVGGDFDRDGKPDIASGNFSNGVHNMSIFAGRGNGAFVDGVEYGLAGRTAGLIAGDLDNDGRPDIVNADEGEDMVGIHLNSPPLTRDPGRMNFPSTPKSTVSPVQVLTITNLDTSAFKLEGFSFSGDNPDDFDIGATTCVQPKPTGASCTVRLRFTPTGVGKRTATLEIPSNLSTTPTVPLTGIGEGPSTGVTRTGPRAPRFRRVSRHAITVPGSGLIRAFRIQCPRANDFCRFGKTKAIFRAGSTRIPAQVIAPKKIKGGASTIVKIRITKRSRRLLDRGRKSGSVNAWIFARSSEGHRLAARSIRIGLKK